MCECIAGDSKGSRDRWGGQKRAEEENEREALQIKLEP